MKASIQASLPCINYEYRIANIALFIMLLLAAFCPLTINIHDISETSFSSNWAPPSCFVKLQTGKPCQACGLTRSVAALYQGEWSQAKNFHSSGPFILALLYFEMALRLLIALLPRKLTWHLAVPWFDMLHWVGVCLLLKYVILTL